MLPKYEIATLLNWAKDCAFFDEVQLEVPSSRQAVREGGQKAMNSEEFTRRQAERKQKGVATDPSRAEPTWSYGKILDPSNDWTEEE